MQEQAALTEAVDAANVALSPTVLRLGTRGSALALVQTRIVQNLLSDAAPSIQTVIRIIQSLGDHVWDFQRLAALQCPGDLYSGH